MNASTKQAKTQPQSKKRNGRDGLYCPECNKGPFTKPNVLGRHRRTEHNILGTSHSTVEARRRKERLALAAQTSQESQTTAALVMPQLLRVNKTDPTKKTQCPECKQMIDTTRLNGHRRAQHGIEVVEDFHKCPDCDLSFSTMGLAIHRRAKHGTLGKSNKKYEASVIANVIRQQQQTAIPPLETTTETALETSLIVHKGRPSNASKGLLTIRRSHHKGSIPPKEIANASEATLRSTTPTATTSATRQDNHHPTTEEEGAIAYTVGRLEAELIQQAIRFDLPPKQFTHWCIEHLQRITSR